MQVQVHYHFGFELVLALKKLCASAFINKNVSKLPLLLLPTLRHPLAEAISGSRC